MCVWWLAECVDRCYSWFESKLFLIFDKEKVICENLMRSDDFMFVDDNLKFMTNECIDSKKWMIVIKQII